MQLPNLLVSTLETGDVIGQLGKSFFRYEGEFVHETMRTRHEEEYLKNSVYSRGCAARSNQCTGSDESL